MTLERPTRNVVSITSGYTEHASASFQTQRIECPDGTVRTVRYGVRKVLTPFPRPVLGCYLNSSIPKWACYARFHRDRLPFGDPYETRSVAAALGPEPVAPQGPILADRATLSAVLDRVR